METLLALTIATVIVYCIHRVRKESRNEETVRRSNPELANKTKRMVDLLVDLGAMATIQTFKEHTGKRITFHYQNDTHILYMYAMRSHDNAYIVGMESDGRKEHYIGDPAEITFKYMEEKVLEAKKCSN